MNELSPMSDLIADDLLLDRLAGRVDAGSEPVAQLLGALAAHADTPLPSRTGRRRIANKHRYFGAFAALAVAASGAGVAAAVTLPSSGPSQADRARIERLMDDSTRSQAPSGLLTRLGLPRTAGTLSAKGLVLTRRDDGTIVLVPAALAAAQRSGVGSGATVVSGLTGGGQDGAAAASAQGGHPQAVRNQGGNGQGGNGQGGNGQGGAGQGGAGQGGQGDEQDGAAAGGAPSGTPQANNGKKSVTGTKGRQKPTPTAGSDTVPTVPAAPTATTAATAAVAPQTTLAPSVTTSPTARSTGTSPTRPPRGRPTPKAPGRPGAAASDALPAGAQSAGAQTGAQAADAEAGAQAGAHAAAPGSPRPGGAPDPAARAVAGSADAATGLPTS